MRAIMWVFICLLLREPQHTDFALFICAAQMCRQSCWVSAALVHSELMSPSNKCTIHTSLNLTALLIHSSAVNLKWILSTIGTAKFIVHYWMHKWMHIHIHAQQAALLPHNSMTPASILRLGCCSSHVQDVCAWWSVDRTVHCFKWSLMVTVIFKIHMQKKHTFIWQKSWSYQAVIRSPLVVCKEQKLPFT